LGKPPLRKWDFPPVKEKESLQVDVSKVYEARRAIAQRIRALPDEGFDEGEDARDAYLPDGKDDPEDSAEDEVSQ
jgi:hypothetical protein